MRVVYMGTPSIAVPPLKAIIEAGHEVVAVVSQPDKPKGRGRSIEPTQVKLAACEQGIPVLQPVKSTDPFFIEEMIRLSPDVAVVMAFGQKIPRALLELPKYGFINIHASLLPLYRGAAPVQRAIMDGRGSTGVTIMYMNEEMDAGDIGLTGEIPILDSDDAGSVLEKVSIAGSELIVRMLRLLEQGEAPRTRQDQSLASPARKITKDDELINWNSSPHKIVAIIRALSPVPGARASIGGSEMKVLIARAVDLETGISQGLPVPVPGLAFVAQDGSLCASANGGWVEITKLRPSGGKTMQGKDYTRGRRLSGKVDMECHFNEVR